MKVLRFIALSLIIFFMFNCKEKSETILLADREAPLGWITLKIFKNETFEFISSGLRGDDEVYSGTVRLSNDTLYFKYSGKIPEIGKTAIINEKFINYIDGSYSESIKIKLNKLKK